MRRSGENAHHLVDILLNLNLEAALRKSAALQLLAIPWDAALLVGLSHAQALKTLTETALAIEGVSGLSRPTPQILNAPSTAVSTQKSATDVRPRHVQQEDHWMLQSACLRIVTGLAQAQCGSLGVIRNLVFRCDIACRTRHSGSCLSSQHMFTTWRPLARVLPVGPWGPLAQCLRSSTPTSHGWKLPFSSPPASIVNLQTLCLSTTVSLILRSLPTKPYSKKRAMRACVHACACSRAASKPHCAKTSCPCGSTVGETDSAICEQALCQSCAACFSSIMGGEGGSCTLRCMAVVCSRGQPLCSCR